MGAGSCPHPQPEWGFLANPWFSRLRMNFAESHGFAGHLESQPQTIVTLNAKISAAQLPPPPFRRAVKGAPCPLQLAAWPSAAGRLPSCKLLWLECLRGYIFYSLTAASHLIVCTERGCWALLLCCT